MQFAGELLQKTDPVTDAPSDRPRGSDRPQGADKPKGTDKPQGSDKPKDVSAADSPQDDGKFPAGLRGFRGILAGKVVSTDTEKGVLVFQATEVKRTWPKNAATNPGSCKGKELTVNGIAGKWVDVLLTLKQGDALEVEAFHNRGEALDFVGEWLKKIE
jgi:hypothetical protein